MNIVKIPNVTNYIRVVSCSILKHKNLLIWFPSSFGFGRRSAVKVSNLIVTRNTIEFFATIKRLLIYKLPKHRANVNSRNTRKARVTPPISGTGKKPFFQYHWPSSPTILSRRTITCAWHAIDLNLFDFNDIRCISLSFPGAIALLQGWPTVPSLLPGSHTASMLFSNNASNLFQNLALISKDFHLKSPFPRIDESLAGH